MTQVSTPLLSVAAAIAPRSATGAMTAIQGPPGRDGAAGRDGPQPLTYHFPTPVLVWTIVHNLGRYPAGLTKINSAGDMIHGATAYPDLDRIQVTFSAPTSGSATLF